MARSISIAFGSITSCRLMRWRLVETRCVLCSSYEHSEENRLLRKPLIDKTFSRKEILRSLSLTLGIWMESMKQVSSSWILKSFSSSSERLYAGDIDMDCRSGEQLLSILIGGALVLQMHIAEKGFDSKAGKEVPKNCGLKKCNQTRCNKIVNGYWLVVVIPIDSKTYSVVSLMNESDTNTRSNDRFVMFSCLQLHKLRNNE